MKKQSGKNYGRPKFSLALCCAALLLLLAPVAMAAPAAKLWPRWEAHNASNSAILDHGQWASFLDKYISAGEDGIGRLAYGKVTSADRALLGSYLTQLQRTVISDYSRSEQLAYWINLYNATTVKVILDHYPVDSITDIDISPGFFSNGPWDAKLVKVEGEDLSLNDIEHRILRPIWRDPRIHYSVNCASMGCPDLLDQPYTGATAEAQLEAAARRFVNHPRGARFDGDRLVVSKIYDWYQVDFGDSDAGVVQHLRLYAEGELSKRLASWKSGLGSDYDWRLNQPEE